MELASIRSRARRDFRLNPRLSQVERRPKTHAPTPRKYPVVRGPRRLILLVGWVQKHRIFWRSPCAKRSLKVSVTAAVEDTDIVCEGGGLKCTRAPNKQAGNGVEDALITPDCHRELAQDRLGPLSIS